MSAATRVFDFDAAAYTEQYARCGYVHVQGGVAPGFVEYALAQASQLIGADADLKAWQFKGKKSQFLFDFPERSRTPDWRAVKAWVASATGLRRRLTLCERHIKVYDANAPETPPPHKDRLASEVAVGFPLIVSEGSHLVLFPECHTEVNRFSTTELHRRSLDAEALPEKLLAGVEPVRIDMQPGDVVLFRGSRIYHERIRPANSVVLYLKFNTLGLDPLGEDPATPARRAASLQRLETSSEAQLLELALAPSPRLERVTRVYSRLQWSELLQAHVSAEKEFGLSELDFALIKAADGATPIAKLLEYVGCGRSERQSALSAIRRLVRLQALDLVMPSSRAAASETEEVLARLATAVME